MRAPAPSSSWLNRTSLGDTALNSFTGTLTSPKLMAPLQMALGMSVARRAHSRGVLTARDAPGCVLLLAVVPATPRRRSLPGTPLTRHNPSVAHSADH